TRRLTQIGQRNEGARDLRWSVQALGRVDANAEPLDESVQLLRRKRAQDIDQPAASLNRGLALCFQRHLVAERTTLGILDDTRTKQNAKARAWESHHVRPKAAVPLRP